MRSALLGQFALSLFLGCPQTVQVILQTPLNFACALWADDQHCVGQSVLAARGGLSQVFFSSVRQMTWPLTSTFTVSWFYVNTDIL